MALGDMRLWYIYFKFFSFFLNSNSNSFTQILECVSLFTCKTLVSRIEYIYQYILCGVNSVQLNHYYDVCIILADLIEWIAKIINIAFSNWPNQHEIWARDKNDISIKTICTARDSHSWLPNIISFHFFTHAVFSISQSLLLAVSIAYFVN